MNTNTQLNALTATAPSERVSSKYQFVSSSQLIEDLRVNGWDLVGTVNRTKTGLGKHAMRFRNPSMRLPSGDFLDIVALNSHDGSTSVQLNLGVWRLVCSNGLMVGTSVVPTIFIRHVGYVQSKVTAAISQLLNQASLVEAVVERLQARILTIEEYSTFVNEALKTRGLEAHKVSAEQLHVPRRPEDAGLTAWVAFNRIQEYSIHGFRYTDLEENRLKTARRIVGAKSQIDVNKSLFDAIVKIAA